MKEKIPSQIKINKIFSDIRDYINRIFTGPNTKEVVAEQEVTVSEDGKSVIIDGKEFKVDDEGRILLNTLKQGADLSKLAAKVIWLYIRDPKEVEKIILSSKTGLVNFLKLQKGGDFSNIETGSIYFHEIADLQEAEKIVVSDQVEIVWFARL